MDARHDPLFQQLAAAFAPLPDKPEENAENTWRALWFAAAGQPRSAIAAMRDELPPLDDEARQALQRLVERRLAGEPLAHLVGRCHFMGLELFAGPAALIPRAATELLVQAAAERLHAIAATRPPRIVDVCTGSGVFALVLATRFPQAEVLAADLDADALALAARNREHLGLARVELRHGDLLAPFGGDFDATVDLLICSPPYILSHEVERMAPEISAHEPRLAFDGGPLGVAVLLRLLEDAPRLLCRGGWLAFEAGQKLGPAMARRLARDPHFDEVHTVDDAHGDVRAVLARRT